MDDQQNQNDQNAQTQDNEVQNESLEKIKQLESLVLELDDKYKRVLAEKFNEQKQFENQKAFMNVKLLEQIIDMKDELEVVMNQVPEGDKEGLGFMGMSMVHGKMTILLMTNNVIEIEVHEGDEFKALTHEAISVEEKDGMKNKIVRVIRKGYMLQDRVLRPVRVIVGN